MSTIISLFALCVLSFLTAISAQREDFTPNSREINRLFFISSSGPVTRAINEFAEAVIEPVNVILNHVSFIERKMLSALKSGKQLRPNGVDFLCETNSPLVNNSIFRTFGLRGLPDPDRACITEVPAEGDSLSEDAPYSVDELYSAMNDRGVILNKNIKQIAAAFIDVEKNFTRPEIPHAFKYNTESARCVLHTACGARVGADWRIETRIHNKGKYESVPDFGRQVISEYGRAVNGRYGDPLRMRVQEFRTDDLPRRTVPDATTFIFNTGRSTDPYCFRPRAISDNSAMQDALRKVENDPEKTYELLKPSSIAILIFPLGFILVPVALLWDQEVSKRRFLLYIFLTDVLTCIPLLIRGIELLTVRRNVGRAFTVRVTAALSGARSEAAAMEVWAAECRPRNIGLYGIAFVAGALGFMALGVAAEVWAKRYARDAKQKLLAAAYEGRGHLLGVWAKQDATEKPKNEAPPPEIKEEPKRVSFFEGEIQPENDE